jgi:hypothetical protein
MSNIQRVEKVLETEVGIRAQERAFEEATRRFGKEVTSRQCIAAILDVRTKSLSHFEDINEKHKAKDFVRKAYISWGMQAHRFSDALLQQAVQVKLEASRSADAEAEEPSPPKKRKVADHLDWDDDAGEGGVFTTLEQQLEAEFACVWVTWMRDVDVPWASLFPHGPKSVRWGEEISMDNLEDWLTLDMRVAFKWLAGETQVRNNSS